MTAEARHQAAIDDRRQEFLARRGAQGRQQAIADFILGCSQLAIELNQLLHHRRGYGPTPAGDEATALIEQHVAAEFRAVFGHPLFVQPLEPAYCRECGCDLPATTDGDRISLCLRCRINPPDVG